MGNDVEVQRMVPVLSQDDEDGPNSGRQKNWQCSPAGAAKIHRDNAWPELASQLTLIAGELLTAVIGGAPSTNPDFHISGVDIYGGRVDGYRNRGSITTPQALTEAVPKTVKWRQIHGITVLNRGNAAMTLSLYVSGGSGGTSFILDSYSVPAKSAVVLTQMGIFVATLTRHDQLAELTDDDHTQYLLLAGRSGGQTINGSTAASENLTLKGTAHATPGRVLIHRPQIQDAAANPSAAGDAWFNSTLWKFYDTALRRVAPFKDAAPTAGYFPRWNNSNSEWEAVLFGLSNSISVTLNSDENDWNPTGFSSASVIKASPATTARTVTGLSGGTDGRIVTIINMTSIVLTLPNESSSSSAANRFYLGGTRATGNHNLVLFRDDSVMLIYDGTDSRWKVLATYISPRRCLAYNASSGQSISNVTVTAVNLNAEETDSVSMHDNSTNNQRIAVDKAGTYFLTANFYWGNTTGGNRRQAIIRKNGTTNLVLTEDPPPASASQFLYQQVATFADLAAGDYVELVVYQDSGGSYSVGTGRDNASLGVAQI